MGKRPGGNEGSENARKKSKAKYFNHAKKSWHGSGVPTGTWGFLVTCFGGKETTSMRESISVLEEEWELLQSSRCAGGEEAVLNAEEPSDEESDDDDDDGECSEPETSALPHDEALRKQEGRGDGDIDKLLESEFGQLRDRKQARFAGVDTGCKGIVYIRMARPKRGEECRLGPVDLALAVLRKAAKTKVTKTRYCMRLLPAEITTYASEDEIVKAVTPLLQSHFPSGGDQTPIKYSVVFEARANAALDRMTIINKIAELVPKPHSVDLSHPQKCIMVQVLKSTCLLSVLTEFKELAKYNLQQLTMPEDKKAAAKKGPQAGALAEHEADGDIVKKEDASPDKKGDLKGEVTEESAGKEDDPKVKVVGRSSAVVARYVYGCYAVLRGVHGVRRRQLGFKESTGRSSMGWGLLK